MEGASEGPNLRAVGRSMAELLQEVAEGMNARIRSENTPAGVQVPGEEKKVRLERREALRSQAIQERRERLERQPPHQTPARPPSRLRRRPPPLLPQP